jgi:hypothetical protein
MRELDALQTIAPTPLPTHRIPPVVDEMERADGRTALGTLRVNSTDAGTEHATMMFPHRAARSEQSRSDN